MLILAVALPALALAGTGVWLTLRVARQVEAESARYNAYLAEKVIEAFERELVEQVRGALVTAEAVSRTGGTPEEIRSALAARARLFEAPQFVPLEQLEGYSLVVVDNQLLIYGDDPSGQREHPFAAMLLNGPDGYAIGAGGWWFNPRSFLATNLRNVVIERLPQTPRMYGGLESTRHLAIGVTDDDGHEVAHVRESSSRHTARIIPMTGPFEGYHVRVSATLTSPVAFADRLVVIEVAFIALLTLVMLGSTFVGARYIFRQVELVNAKTSFVSNVTHELKTPIAVIKLAVETLELGRYRTDEERDKYLRTIMRESDRLAQLVDNILDFSRMEAGQRTLNLGPVDVRDVVHSGMEGFRLRLEDAGFHYEVKLPDTLPQVLGDSRALHHCLLNLLDNAVKYSKDRKDIRVVVGTQDGMVTLAVTDLGIGIPPEDQERIFEKFARAESGLVHNVKGAGLGLSLVEMLVRAHHGRVDVASTPGNGSTFTILLPIWDGGRGSGNASA
ncbi:MAG: HAMP domain-containing sensor histidine kinase [Candidatus Eisenbacteria bacterium]